MAWNLHGFEGKMARVSHALGKPVAYCLMAWFTALQFQGSREEDS